MRRGTRPPSTASTPPAGHPPTRRLPAHRTSRHARTGGGPPVRPRPPANGAGGVGHPARAAAPRSRCHRRTRAQRPFTHSAPHRPCPVRPGRTPSDRAARAAAPVRPGAAVHGGPPGGRPRDPAHPMEATWS
jgi:hypothetical protein